MSESSDTDQSSSERSEHSKGQSNKEQSKPSIPRIYYRCNDARLPVCREFVNQGRCRRGKKCRFYHPVKITPIIKKQTQRALGCCYCGAPQKCVMNTRSYRVGEDDSIPTFYVICSRTKRSM